MRQVLADQTFQVPIDTGDTPEALATIGANFITVSTTANLAGSGTTPDHRLFLWNLKSGLDTWHLAARRKDPWHGHRSRA